MTYSQPADIRDALKVLKQGDPKVVAGGTDVYPTMRQGLAPHVFLDTTRIQGFKDIDVSSQSVRFGAAVTWSDVVRSDLPSAFDGLKQAAREVGSIQIQNVGTLAGNICNASPAADGVPPLLALNAKVEVSSDLRGTRVLPLDAFITGVRQTCLEPDELVTALIIPTPQNGMRSAFEKLGSRRYLVISISMSAVNVLLDADGRVEEARIAVGSCSTVAQRLFDLEADLVGSNPDDIEISAHHLAPLSPIDDVRGTGAFRLHAVRQQILRAFEKAVRQ